MLKLTKKADYGLIALRHLATTSGRSASAKDMSDAYRIPAPILSKVLQQLVRGGLLISEQGASGGYRLSRPAQDISALEAIRTIDGPIVLTACFTDHAGCNLSDDCTVREPLRKIHEGILRLLASISISDMAKDSPSISGNQIFQLGPVPQSPPVLHKG